MLHHSFTIFLHRLKDAATGVECALRILKDKSLVVSLKLIFMLFVACTKEPSTLLTGNEYTLAVPANFIRPQIPAGNPMKVEVVTLGRQLFFEPLLSGDNQISCASCHLPSFAFADSMKQISTGVNGKFTQRNTLPLFNLAWNKSFLWDGGVNDLESQVIVPITDEHEMNESFANLIFELQATQKYPPLFKIAFGSDSITGQKILAAIAQFERTLISGNSDYDLYVRGESQALSPRALHGLQVYRKKCSTCHTEGLFTDHLFHNNGVDSSLADFTIFNNPLLGRARITSQPDDIGKYRTPSLRNIAFTAPYMHDGRFKTLEEVIEHYKSGILISPTLDPIFKNLQDNKIPLTDEEISALKEFLNSLTDRDFIQKNHR